MPQEPFKPDPFYFAYKRVRDPKTNQITWVRLVSPQIPDEILTTGNPEILRTFYQTHKDTLTPADLKYMHTRMVTAFKLEQLERKAKEELGRGETPPLQEVTREKGYTGLKDIKLSGPQTSDNGCWSCGLHLLLKARGVDLTQEEIRAYRPDFKPGEEQAMTEERRMTMDSDSTNYIFDQSDLVHKVLPNSCVTNVTLRPLPDIFRVVGGPEQAPYPLETQGFATLSPAQQQERMNAWQKEQNTCKANIRKAYNKQVRIQMGDMIRKALIQDRSPVVLNVGGCHYITVTGISDDGKKIRVEDSLGSKDHTTNYLVLDDLIKQNLGPDGKGMTMTWIKDLPTPEYVPQDPEQTEEKRNEKMAQNLATAEENARPKLFENSKDCIKVSGDGGLTVQNVENTNIIASSDPHPQQGMLNGLTVSDSVVLDQSNMGDVLQGGTLKNDVMNMDSPEATMYLGDQQFYYPKKLCCKGDPTLQAGALQTQALDKQRQTAEELDERIKHQPMTEPAPEAGTFAAAIREQKDKLYLQATDTVLYLAKIYALNKVMQGKQAEAGQDKTQLQITEEEGQNIEAMTRKVIPTMSVMLNLGLGKVKLPIEACKDDPGSFLGLVDGYASQKMVGANANLDQRKDVLTEALNAMTATGTGRNYFGFKRDSNSPEYDAMLAELQSYKNKLDLGLTPDGFDNYNLTQKCLRYIDGKLKVRSTTTGVVRFDNTMRVLQQIMPGKEFEGICNRINQVRGVAAMAYDKNYVSAKRYAPKAKEPAAEKKAAPPQGPTIGSSGPG